MPASRSFLDASIPDLVKKLRVDEKVSLLAGPNWWNTSAVERLEIPAIRMSDGPNGVRGSSHFLATPAQCLPCATALAATFDPDLVHEVGEFLAEEAKIKSSVVLLAPTCNIQRNPLGGRSFESFSEDPHLSGTLAAAYVNGLQSKGVAATIKHFVGNDQEDERTAAESVMSNRALREVYLYPFMLAQIHAQPWAYMTSYGRINGVHCSESRELLQGILRDEWGFDGIVMSDWYGTYGTDQPLNAGLELEMPGPPRWRTLLLMLHTMSCQKLLASTLDRRVANMLTFIQRQAKRNPEIVYGDGNEGTRDTPEMHAFGRRVAGESIVLLKNEGEVLPLTNKVKKIAMVGPNVHGRVISGGGSAALAPSYVVTPYEGLKAALGDGYEISYHVGCYAHKYLPTLEDKLKTPEGEPGWKATFYKHDENGNPTEPLATYILKDTRLKLNDFILPGITPTWTIKVEGDLTVPRSGPFELGLTVAGRAKLWVDGKLSIDNWSKQTPGDFFYGQGTIEEKAVVDLEAGKPVRLNIEYTNTPPPDQDSNDERRNAQPALMRGVRLGGAEKIDPDKAIEDAAALAKESDVVIFVGGLTPEWESEGFDRPTLSMPGRQDETIQRLAKANPKTVVCIQAGSAVSMPWIDSVAGVLQTWYLGNEVGNAIADVLSGKINPAGKLPITLPVKKQDIPAYPHLGSERGKIYYREDVFVGYKHYQTHGVTPLFPFGFGLSYTTFSLSDLDVKVADGPTATVSVKVKNDGKVAGSQVVQVYVSYPDLGIAQPEYQLRGFAKVKDIKAGETKTAKIKLDKYAVAYWDEREDAWVVAPGKYGVHVGFSSEELSVQTEVEVKERLKWRGL
ncbi:glycoside hydrolase family 3 protein [Schizophyllum commune Loenen D]|nr:glycoside hydrolase family 3 protein [Schizophyllum commune Loenen D]